MTNEQYPRRIQDLGPLSAAEKIVLETCGNGDAAKIGDTLPSEMTDTTRVRAGLIRYMMLGGCDTHPSHERGVRIEGAWIDGEINLDFCKSALRLRLDGCAIPNGLTCGLAELIELSLKRCSVSEIFAQSATIKGNVFLSEGFQSNGKVDFLGATIGGQLNLASALMHHANGKAFNGQSLRINGDVFVIDGFTAVGEIDLNGANFERLVFNDATLNNPHGNALSLFETEISTSLMWWDVDVTAGTVDLRGLHVDMLEDKPESWPDDLRLDGFTYNRIMQNTDVDARLGWLAKNKSTDFKPQPYQQLAKVFGDIGHRIDRARVLRRMENGIRAQQRKTMLPGRRAIKRVSDEIMRIVVGYGYFPERALIAGLVLIAATWAGIFYVTKTGAMTPTAAPVLMSSDWQETYAPMEHAGTNWAAIDAPGKDYETLRPLLYAFDVVVPLINIGQETTWGPSTSRGTAGIIAHWALPIVKTLGWIITALGAAAVTGTIRRD